MLTGSTARRLLPTLMVVTLATPAFAQAGAAARPATPGREGYVTTSDSARLFYRVVGRGADTLIALHGGPGVDLESIAGDFASLGDRHVVIFYDQRGAGRSDLPKDTTRLVVSRQIADLDDVRRHFKLEQVALVAHSYGPLLAASYALAHPSAVSKMVFFGQFRDWGPFDRERQPVRFWLSITWAALFSLAFPLWIWALIEEGMK
jgi:proline iminopeptidase